MLKVKRIAKVMLCICVAFSMFLTVNADSLFLKSTTISYAGNIIENNKFVASNPNSITIYYYNVPGNILEKDTIYTLYVNLYYYDVNGNDPNCDKYEIRISLPRINLQNTIGITYNILNNTLSANRINVIKYKIENNIAIIKFSVPELGNYTVSNFTNIYLSYHSTGYFDSSEITVNNISNANYSFEIYREETKTESFINTVNNTFNSLIINANNIFSFITDKPWIILLGVSVSLISFLIYKAKTII